jgi:flagellar protein FliS
MSYARHLQTYRENQIHTADPGTILLMLYQGAIDFLRQAKASLERGDVVEKGRCIARAHAIVSEFLASLDLRVGGELAQNLESLYVFMLDQITAANLSNDPKPLEVVVSLLTTLKEGWEEAVAAERKRVSQEGVWTRP